MHDWKTVLSFWGNLGIFSGAFSVSCREGIRYIIGHTNILLSERRHMGYGSDTVPILEGQDVARWRDSPTPMWYFPIGKWWIFSIISSTYMCVPEGYSCLVMTFLVSNRLMVLIFQKIFEKRWNLNYTFHVHPPPDVFFLTLKISPMRSGKMFFPKNGSGLKERGSAPVWFAKKKASELSIQQLDMLCIGDFTCTWHQLYHTNSSKRWFWYCWCFKDLVKPACKHRRFWWRFSYELARLAGLKRIPQEKPSRFLHHPSFLSPTKLAVSQLNSINLNGEGADQAPRYWKWWSLLSCWDPQRWNEKLSGP